MSAWEIIAWIVGIVAGVYAVLILVNVALKHWIIWRLQKAFKVVSAETAAINARHPNPRNGHPYGCGCGECAIFWDSAPGELLRCEIQERPISDQLRRAAALSEHMRGREGVSSER